MNIIYHALDTERSVMIIMNHHVRFVKAVQSAYSCVSYEAEVTIPFTAGPLGLILCWNVEDPPFCSGS